MKLNVEIADELWAVMTPQERDKLEYYLRVIASAAAANTALKREIKNFEHQFCSAQN